MNMDDILIKFIADNSLTLWTSLTLLKGLAKISPWSWDDSVVALLFGVFKTFNPEKRKLENDKMV